jgi:hypothetical protein
VFDKALAVVGPEVDAESEMRAGYCHRSLKVPHSSSASRFTAGAAFFCVSLQKFQIKLHARACAVRRFACLSFSRYRKVSCISVCFQLLDPALKDGA